MEHALMLFTLSVAVSVNSVPEARKVYHFGNNPLVSSKI